MTQQQKPAEVKEESKQEINVNIEKCNAAEVLEKRIHEMNVNIQEHNNAEGKMRY